MVVGDLVGVETELVRYVLMSLWEPRPGGPNVLLVLGNSAICQIGLGQSSVRVLDQ